MTYHFHVRAIKQIFSYSIFIVTILLLKLNKKHQLCMDGGKRVHPNQKSRINSTEPYRPIS
jgi:hypothetical protein